ncbi:MAG: ATP-binding protein, partial [Prevotella sp.]|nr:ATP-binding protein [Prevotella sp.]
MKAPVRIFIFDNRVEIHSPGALPYGLTIDDIKAGTSMPRNMFLFNNAIYLLPYTGVSSGITRALDEDINVTFMNNDKAQEFVITVWRGESNQVEDLDTRLRHSDTDLDTGLRHSNTDLDTGLRHSDTDLDTKRVTLTNKEKDIVNFCSVPRTTKEILDRIGVSMHSKNRERYITSLV